MIDISKNVIHTYINEKSCKAYSKNTIYAIYDKQIRSVFINYLKHKNQKENIFFTKNTIQRIEKMDISKVEPSSLSFLGQKYNNEFSFCFLEKENISFCYSIDFNSVKFIVFNGNQKSLIANENETFTKSKDDYFWLQKTIIGSAIINFDLNEKQEFPSNALHFVLKRKSSEDMLDYFASNDVPPDYVEDLKKASKNEDYRKGLTEDYQIKSSIIFLAIKSFVFLKTASVIDKTFISESKKFGVKNKFGIAKKNDDITVINSFYDESIFVLNPFSVSGHFRNQPKKNGVEVIYIDSFMKQGYNRPAKILLQSEDNSPIKI